MRNDEVNEMNEREEKFLQMIHDPTLRPTLLGRLEKLGLLSAFLAVENGTMTGNECLSPK